MLLVSRCLPRGRLRRSPRLHLWRQQSRRFLRALSAPCPVFRFRLQFPHLSLLQPERPVRARPVQRARLVPVLPEQPALQWVVYLLQRLVPLPPLQRLQRRQPAEVTALRRLRQPLHNNHVFFVIFDKRY